MEVIAEETVQLPLYDQPLASATPGMQPIEETANSVAAPGQFQIRETRADSGIVSVTVTHLVDGDTRTRYRFDVIDFEQRICRYTGSDSPPWPVYCAVTRFGYHCQTVPESPRQYTLDLLSAASIELINQLKQVNEPYLAGGVGRVAHSLYEYVNLSAIEVQIGADQMASLPEQLDGDETFAEQLFEALETSEVADPFVPHSLGHPSTQTLLGANPTGDSSDEGDTETIDSTADDSIETTIVTADIVDARGRGDRSDELYVYRITGDAIDRFSFHITDKDAATCVAQTGVVGDLPPYDVIEFVSEKYTITNLPDFIDPSLSQAERLLKVDRVVRKAVAQVPPESEETKRILDQYLRELSLVLCIAGAYEIAPVEYDRAVRSVFDQLGVELQVETISQLRFEHLDQLTTAALTLLDEDQYDAITSRSRNLLSSARIEDRRLGDTDGTLEGGLLG